MRKLASLALGLALGAAVGAAVMVLFAPVSGEQLKQNLRLGWDEAMEDARKAAEARRVELEADLARRRGKERIALP